MLYIKPTLTAETIGEDAVTKNGKLNLWSGQPSMACTGIIYFLLLVLYILH